MKATCSYCGNRWQLTPEALALALEKSPSKGRSINVECPKCRRLVKLARPARLPVATPPPPAVGAEAEDGDGDGS